MKKTDGHLLLALPLVPRQNGQTTGDPSYVIRGFAADPNHDFERALRHFLNVSKTRQRPSRPRAVVVKSAAAPDGTRQED
jgi:hypothetical protein